MYGPQKCIKHSSKIKSIKDAIEIPAPTLVELQKELGKNFALSYIGSWLLYINDMISVNHKMTDMQMEFTAQRIFETYSLKITDLTLFFKNLLSGVYGPFYERMSPNLIMNALSKYFDERCEYGTYIYEKNKFKEQKLSMPDVSIQKEIKNIVDKRHITPIKRSIKSESTALLMTKSAEELNQYLKNNPEGSNTHDSSMYRLVNDEIRRRAS